MRLPLPLRWPSSMKALIFYWHPTSSLGEYTPIGNGSVRVEEVLCKDLVHALDKASPRDGETVLNTVSAVMTWKAKGNRKWSKLWSIATSEDGNPATITPCSHSKNTVDVLWPDKSRCSLDWKEDCWVHRG